VEESATQQIDFQRFRGRFPTLGTAGGEMLAVDRGDENKLVGGDLQPPFTEQLA